MKGRGFALRTNRNNSGETAQEYGRSRVGKISLTCACKVTRCIACMSFTMCAVLRVCVLLVACISSVGSQSSSYGERGSALGLQVFLRVVQNKPLENVVLSPHGVASILGMLLPGAHGETRRQLLMGLKYKKTGPYKMLRKLHKSLTTKSNADIVTIANALFPKKGLSIHEDFLTANRDNFLCESQTLDYSNPERAADTINEWVKNSTKGHIPTLVKPDMLDPGLTRLVAVNSIYFKGLWKSQFQAQNTKPRTFTAGDGKSYKVPMMSKMSYFNIANPTTPEGVYYTVIELPYHGNSMSMFIAIPSQEDTPLSAILPHISTATIQSWTKLLDQRRISFSMPKFTAEAEVDLQAPLTALGIKDLFDEVKADFRHMSSEPVHVSKALQKAKIEVNEAGTKASAATTAILHPRSSPPMITLDRPFLFLIRHNPTGTILFAGQINKP